MWQIFSEDATEQQEFSIIEAHIGRMVNYAEDFSAALSLFNFCDRFDARLTSNWSFVAARDGAMTIYHVGKTIELTRSALKRAPTLDALLNQEYITTASKQYRDSFPTFEKVRHAVSHSSELFRDQTSLGKNRVKDGFVLPEFDGSQFRDTIITNSLFGRTYTNTIDGKIVTYEISEATKQTVYTCVNMFIQGFGQVYRDHSRLPQPRW